MSRRGIGQAAHVTSEGEGTVKERGSMARSMPPLRGAVWLPQYLTIHGARSDLGVSTGNGLHSPAHGSPGRRLGRGLGSQYPCRRMLGGQHPSTSGCPPSLLQGTGVGWGAGHQSPALGVPSLTPWELGFGSCSPLSQSPTPPEVQPCRHPSQKLALPADWHPVACLAGNGCLEGALGRWCRCVDLSAPFPHGVEGHDDLALAFKGGGY
mmetsp:Transcript_31622/g.56760  ORF Transcript_31622/g.56760 Transcript_31622/m.56760 type:complete len:209 (+) Transcript_31622:410-1036(+)